MELITSPKTAYLLEAGLEVLHHQSSEWLQEIAFWKDEAAFLYTLVVKKTIKLIPVNAREELKEIESELISLTCGDLDELQNQVEQHESFLNDLLESKFLDEKFYRRKHEELTFKFFQFERRFKNVKRAIFKLVEQIDKVS